MHQEKPRPGRHHQSGDGDAEDRADDLQRPDRQAQHDEHRNPHHQADKSDPIGETGEFVIR